ncbi:MAG: DUF4198 domain-containing protein [Candidatus Desulforudis sp.]|nr:DUF4198 domain-containing protein [Desulforudis sp.]
MAPHNIWLQCAQRAERGQAVTCRLCYGHYLEADGRAEAERARIWAAGPTLEPEPLEPAAGEDGVEAVFTPAVRGVHAVLAAYARGCWTVTGDGRWLPGTGHAAGDTRTVDLCYFAKRLVFVEDDSPWPGSFAQELEIVPMGPLGKELEVLVQHQGRPLAGAQVYAHCQGKPRARYAVTAPDGKADFGLTPGEWLLLTRHEVPAAAEDIDFRVTNAVFGLTVYW